MVPFPQQGVEPFIDVNPANFRSIWDIYKAGVLQGARLKMFAGRPTLAGRRTAPRETNPIRENVLLMRVWCRQNLFTTCVPLLLTWERSPSCILGAWTLRMIE